MRSDITVQDVIDGFHAGLSIEAMMEKYECSWQLIVNRRKAAGISGRSPNALNQPRGHSGSRFKPRHLDNAKSMWLANDHPAVAEGRALFKNSVVTDPPRLLISGVNQWKIGKAVTKGPWKGFPIFTLTLEERATCPRTCHHWNTCYGNRMKFAKRIKHGKEFEERLYGEVRAMQWKHPDGFAVRLHVLGDFYSVAYAELWVRMLDEFPALHVFGFTARWDDEIGKCLRAVRSKRFAMRFSNAPTDEMSTVTIGPGQRAAYPAIHCPQQTGRTQSCGTCGLCWQTRRPIAFSQH